MHGRLFFCACPQATIFQGIDKVDVLCRYMRKALQRMHLGMRMRWPSLRERSESTL